MDLIKYFMLKSSSPPQINSQVSISVMAIFSIFQVNIEHYKEAAIKGQSNFM